MSKRTGDAIILKVVNAAAPPFETTIDLRRRRRRELLCQAEEGCAEGGDDPKRRPAIPTHVPRQLGDRAARKAPVALPEQNRNMTRCGLPADPPSASTRPRFSLLAPVTLSCGCAGHSVICQAYESEVDRMPQEQTNRMPLVSRDSQRRRRTCRASRRTACGKCLQRRSPQGSRRTRRGYRQATQTIYLRPR